jgi:hypothetical protein
MPENYKPEAGTANSWLRCNHIECNNGHGQAPTIRYDEERRTVLDTGESFGQQTRCLQETFSDPDAPLPIYDPSTGQLSGQVLTDGVAYAVLYSLYMRAALRQDAGAGETETEHGA